MERTGHNDHMVLHCGYSVSLRVLQHAFVCGVTLPLSGKLSNSALPVISAIDHLESADIATEE